MQSSISAARGDADGRAYKVVDAITDPEHENKLLQVLAIIPVIKQNVLSRFMVLHAHQKDWLAAGQGHAIVAWYGLTSPFVSLIEAVGTCMVMVIMNLPLF